MSGNYAAGSPEANALDAAGFADPNVQSLTVNGVTYGPAYDPSTANPVVATGRYGIPSAALGAWADGLQPASWRGVPFAVKSSTIRPGRKVVIHDYPGRDVVWVEDQGKKGRRISFTGFLVGDDVYDQQAAMLDAMDAEGPGNLVHPALGTISVSFIDGSTGDRADLGRVVELEFSFVQGIPQAQFPSTDASTQDAVTDAADECDDDCGGDFLDDITSALAQGEAVVSGVIATAAGFVATVVGTATAIEQTVGLALAVPGAIIGSILGTVGRVVGLINDAAIGASVVLGLPGYFGRYAYGGLTSPLPATATVASQIAALATSRAAVAAAAGDVLTAAQSDQSSLAGAVQSVIASMVATIPDPGDQLRLLAVLAAYNPAIVASTAPIGGAAALAQTATAALIRRAACAGLARAAAAYQPTSYNDAMARVDTLTGLLDAEALVAADAGDASSYGALRSLETAVVADLFARGANLPQLVTVTRARSLPALALAYQLYGDATRAPELVARANPVNGLFMPKSFEALAS
jgi:prophage DNA circulation protein